MKLRMIGSFVCILVLGLSSVALGDTPEATKQWPQPIASVSNISDVRYYPNPLYTDDSTIIIKWRADRTLKRHYVYKVRMEITADNHYNCTRISEEELYTNIPKKGHKVSIELSSTSELHHEWCNGKVELFIGYAKKPELLKCPEEKKEAGELEPEPEPISCPEKTYSFHVIFAGEFRIRAKP